MSENHEIDQFSFAIPTLLDMMYENVLTKVYRINYVHWYNYTIEHYNNKMLTCCQRVYTLAKDICFLWESFCFIQDFPIPELYRILLKKSNRLWKMVCHQPLLLKFGPSLQDLLEIIACCESLSKILFGNF